MAGLVTAKVLKADGFEITVYDKAPSIGGVWLPSRTYPDLRTNSTRELYEFSDFPQPDSADEFLSPEQVRRYLDAYVDHFGLRSHIRLSTEVLSVCHRKGELGYEVTVHADHLSRRVGREESSTSNQFDFVVVCNGVFSLPKTPAVPCQEGFAGARLHSSRFNDARQVENRDVVVVGAGKSAVDCAATAARRARSCTLVVRSPRWFVPQYLAGGTRWDYLFLNRFAESFYRYHRLGPLERLVHGPLRPLLNLFWWAMGQVLTLHMKIPPSLRPDTRLPGDLDIGVGAEFYRLVHEGRLQVRRGEVRSLNAPRSVQLDGGERLPADTVIFATGWRQSVDFLEPIIRARVYDGERFHLYRHILPPDEPRLGFVGYASSISCTLTSEMAAHWLSHHFSGQIELPVPEEMEQEIVRVHRWARRIFPAGRAGFFIGPYIAHYVDELMQDMGLPPRRQKSSFSEYFRRFLPARYRTIAMERRQPRQIASTASEGKSAHAADLSSTLEMRRGAEKCSADFSRRE